MYDNVVALSDKCKSFGKILLTLTKPLFQAIWWVSQVKPCPEVFVVFVGSLPSH
jgi:hypothetical protein